LGDTYLGPSAGSIPRDPYPRYDPKASSEQAEADLRDPESRRPRYRPLGDPDNLSLKEAGEILGRARNTVYLWYRKGKFPPAVDVSPYLPYTDKPVIVVPRYRLETWQAGKRMPNILQEVFEIQGLHEAPWAAFRRRKGASREDVDFWVERRGLQKGIGKGGLVIYGEGLAPGKVYELEPIQ
jgi:hypothetical protein